MVSGIPVHLCKEGDKEAECYTHGTPFPLFKWGEKTQDKKTKKGNIHQYKGTRNHKNMRYFHRAYYFVPSGYIKWCSKLNFISLLADLTKI